LDPGSGIMKKPIPDPGSRGPKGTGSRIRIRNNGFYYNFNFFLQVWRDRTSQPMLWEPGLYVIVGPCHKTAWHRGLGDTDWPTIQWPYGSVRYEGCVSKRPLIFFPGAIRPGHFFATRVYKWYKLKKNQKFSGGKNSGTFLMQKKQSFRSGSMWIRNEMAPRDPDPYWEYGSGSRRDKTVHLKREKKSVISS